MSCRILICLSVLHDYLRIKPTAITHYVSFQFFVRPPLPHEWARFVINAARVRSMSYDQSVPDLSEDGWGKLALHRPPLQRLLPNLCKLEWGDDNEAFTSMHLFLGPSLKSITMKRNYADENVCIAVLHAIPYTCPQLEELRLLDTSASFSIYMEDEVASPLVGLPKLTVFDTSQAYIPGKAAYHLARKASLTEAKFAIKARDLSPMIGQITEGDALFSCIRCFSLQVDQLDANSIALLRAISSSSLQELALSADDPTKTMLIDHLQALIDRPNSRQLRSLSLVFPQPRKTFPIANRPEYDIDIEVLERIFSFPDLQHLNIRSFYVNIDDEAVKRIAKTFPQLRTLRLISNFDTGRVPKVTLKGIIHIAQRCEHLVELGIAFNMMTPKVWTIHPGTPYNATLRTLEVGDSPITRAGPAVLFLTAMFSNLSLTISTSISELGENRQLRQQFADVWLDVQMQLAYMSKARQQERTRLEYRCGCPRFQWTSPPEPEDSDQEDWQSDLVGLI